MFKPPGSPRNDDGREHRLYEVKNRVHLRLLERLDLDHVDQFEDKQVAQAIRKALTALLDEEKTPLNQEERLRLAKELEFEILGLGPLEPFMHDPGISDILVNRYDQVYLERGGKLEKTSVRFRDNAHLLNTINKIVTNVGRRIDESSPMVDARLPDGSRVNAIIPPLALDGPMLSIRRFAVRRLTLEELIAKGTLTPDIGEVLQGHRQGQTQYPDLRRHRFGQDHPAQHYFRLYPAQRAHPHHRGLRRTAVAAGARGTDGNQAAQYRGQRGDRPAGPGAQCLAHAPRSHRRGRGPGAGGHGHAPGHEHRP